jgi:hypothetical protein
MTTFDEREQGFEKKYALDRSKSSRPTLAATGRSACGLPA